MCLFALGSVYAQDYDADTTSEDELDSEDVDTSSALEYTKPPRPTYLSSQRVINWHKSAFLNKDGKLPLK